jgi:hypothetical protein
VRVPKKHLVRRHARPRPKTNRTPKERRAGPSTSPRQVVRPGLTAPLSATHLAEKDNPNSPSTIVPLGLGFTFSLSLVLFGLALTPLAILPRTVRSIVYDRREPLLYSAVVIYVTTGLSLGIALLLS